MRHAYDMPVELQRYGKPNKLSFEYAKKVLDRQAEAQGLEISDYFMIGDNPKGDILGSNALGWQSILVQTGIHQPGDVLSEACQPRHEVYGMSDALDVILKHL